MDDSHIRMRNSPSIQRSSVLSATADYALRALIALARDAERPAHAGDIAKRIGAPRNYLAKTLNSLAKAGLVTSARGPLGGFSLARSADSISVAEIADLFDGTRATGRCLQRDQPCDPSHPCGAHARWAGISRAARAALTTTTVGDLVHAPIPPASASESSNGLLP